MTDVNMRSLFEAGVHFGHQTRYWDPKMAPYIYGSRNRVHILNLEKTLPLFKEALQTVQRVASRNGKVLFVGTKGAASEVIKEQAERCEMPYVNFRWLGGMLTNFKTIRQSINRLKDLQAMQLDGTFDKLTKKEALMRSREIEKLDRSLGGIKDMNSLPDLVFVLDVGHQGALRGFLAKASLNEKETSRLLSLIERKALTDYKEYLDQLVLSDEIKQGLLELPTCYGGLDALTDVKQRLKGAPDEVAKAIAEVEWCLSEIVRKCPNVEVYFDLAETRSCHDHSGIVFAAYTEGYGQAIARGGRYEGETIEGQANRPATGFSLDLTLLLKVSQASRQPSEGAIWVPASLRDDTEALVKELREQGKHVVVGLLENEAPAKQCDRQLNVLNDGAWECTKF